MKAVFETIDTTIGSSLKVATYNSGNTCNSIGWHIHREHELVYIKNGSGNLRIDALNEPYENGTIVLLGGNIPHHADLSNAEKTDNLEVVVQFDDAFITKKLEVFPEFKSIVSLLGQSNKVMIFKRKAVEEVSMYFEKFQKLENPQEKLINLLTILSKLSQSKAYYTLFDHATLRPRSDEVNKLEKVFEFVNYNFPNQISIHEVASTIGYTPNSFCRFFKKHTKTKFIDFLNEFRIRKSEILLNNPNTSISAAMYSSGFNNPSYFSRQFKKFRGVTPSEYRKRQV